MKATGIVRRIDELGRVVVPKELRRQLRIDEGDAIEIFTEANGEIVLKKFSPLWGIQEDVEGYAKALAESTDCEAVITDKDQVVAASGDLQGLVGSETSPALKQLAKERKSQIVNRSALEKETYLDWGKDYIPQSLVIAPIISPTGDLIGTVILGSQDKELDEFQLKLAETAASFLSKQVGID